MFWKVNSEGGGGCLLTPNQVAKMDSLAQDASHERSLLSAIVEGQAHVLSDGQSQFTWQACWRSYSSAAPPSSRSGHLHGACV